MISAVKDTYVGPLGNQSASRWLGAIMATTLCLSVGLILLFLAFNRINLVAGTVGLGVLALYSGLVGSFAFRISRGRNLVASAIVIVGGMMVVIVIVQSLVDLLRLSSMPVFGAGLLLLPLIFADAVCLGVMQARTAVSSRKREIYTFKK